MSGYRAVIRALRKKAEMNTLERLKSKAMEIKLAGNFAKYTYMEISADDIVKLLAVVQAASRVEKSDIVNKAPFAGYSEALSDLRDALAALDE